MRSALALLGLVPMLLLWAPHGACAESGYLRFHFKVLDKTSTPVPYATIRLISLSEAGRPYGPEWTWTGTRSGQDGIGVFGFGNLLSPKPGKLKIIAVHPRQAGRAASGGPEEP